MLWHVRVVLLLTMSGDAPEAGAHRCILLPTCLLYSMSFQCHIACLRSASWSALKGIEDASKAMASPEKKPAKKKASLSLHLSRCITPDYLCAPPVHCPADPAASPSLYMHLAMPLCSQSSALQAKRPAAERRSYTLRQRNEAPCSSLPLPVSFVY